MASGKDGFVRSLGALTTGLAAGGLAYLLKNSEAAQHIVTELTKADYRTLDNVATVLGMYAVPASATGAIMLPYYALKSVIEKITGGNTENQHGH